MNNKTGKLLLGLDVGTSGVKGILINEKGEKIGLSTAAYPLSTPKPNWVEQDPADWWNATVQVIKKIVSSSGVNPLQIAGLGLSGQMHSLVLLGKDDEVLRPAILWSDTRTDEECREINRMIDQDTLKYSVGNPAIEGFTLPKILWVKRHEPTVFARISKVLLPKDYIRFKLTGTFAMEVSDASGTMMYDVWKRKWSAEILNKLEVPSAWLPSVFESVNICGTISPVVSGATGLSVGLPVAGGGADNTCGAVGNGVINEGQVLASIGTSGVIFAPTTSVKVEQEMRVHTFCHSVPNRWYVMGVMLMAGGALRWYRDTFAQAEMERARLMNMDAYDLIAAEAETIPAGSEGLFFQPYLAGERTPHRSASARAGFIGATIRHTKNHFSRAAFEGITFGMRDSLEIIKSMGVDVNQIRLTGGGAKNKFWNQLQANIYGCEVVLVNASEGPAFGAALIAGTAAGVYIGLEQAVDQTIRIIERIEPDLTLMKCYNEYYGIYSKIFPNLKDSYTTIHKTFRA
jgi:xylulokinase